MTGRDGVMNRVGRFRHFGSHLYIFLLYCVTVFIPGAVSWCRRRDDVRESPTNACEHMETLA